MTRVRLLYLVEEVWLLLADLLRPNSTGDFPQPNTRLNLSLNLINIVLGQQHNDRGYLEDMVL